MWLSFRNVLIVGTISSTTSAGFFQLMQVSAFCSHGHLNCDLLSSLHCERSDGFPSLGRTQDDLLHCERFEHFPRHVPICLQFPNTCVQHSWFPNQVPPTLLVYEPSFATMMCLMTHGPSRCGGRLRWCGQDGLVNKSASTEDIICGGRVANQVHRERRMCMKERSKVRLDTEAVAVVGPRVPRARTEHPTGRTRQCRLSRRGQELVARLLLVEARVLWRYVHCASNLAMGCTRVMLNHLTMRAFSGRPETTSGATSRKHTNGRRGCKDSAKERIRVDGALRLLHYGSTRPRTKTLSLFVCDVFPTPRKMSVTRNNSARDYHLLKKVKCCRSSTLSEESRVKKLVPPDQLQAKRASR